MQMTGAFIRLRHALEQSARTPRPAYRAFLVGAAIFSGACLTGACLSWPGLPLLGEGLSHLMMFVGLVAGVVLPLAILFCEHPATTSLTRLRRPVPFGFREAMVERPDGERVFTLKRSRWWFRAPVWFVGGCFAGALSVLAFAGLFGFITGDPGGTRKFCADFTGVPALFAGVSVLFCIVRSEVRIGRGAVGLGGMSRLPRTGLESAVLKERGGRVSLELQYEDMADPIPMATLHPIWVASIMEREGIPVTFRPDAE